MKSSFVNWFCNSYKGQKSRMAGDQRELIRFEEKETPRLPQTQARVRIEDCAGIAINARSEDHSPIRTRLPFGALALWTIPECHPQVTSSPIWNNESKTSQKWNIQSGNCSDNAPDAGREECKSMAPVQALSSMKMSIGAVQKRALSLLDQGM